MEITEQNETRLVLRKRGPLLGVLIGLFALVSLVAVVCPALQGIVLVAQRGEPDAFTRVVSLVAFVLLGVGFIGLGTVVGLAVSRGVTCVFDRTTETVTVQKARWLRMQTLTYPIYGVSHLDLQRNEELGLYALALMLRSGERIVLTAEPLVYADQIARLAEAVRHFVRGDLPGHAI